LALSYVGRFATSRAKLRLYLRRKLRERGWAGAGEPPIEALTDRIARLGYVDDHAYALAKTRSLTSRGYGSRRVRQALSQAGIGEEDAADAHELAAAEAFEAALLYARRKKIGPFAASRPDPRGRERALAAMIRAGHGFGLARAIVDRGPGDVPKRDEISNVNC
jgi:regulatory protein